MKNPLPTSDNSEQVHFVREFTREMSEWERAYAKEWRGHLTKYLHDAPEHEMASYRLRNKEIQAKYRTWYVEIFTRYCTLRERKYGGPEGPLSAGTPTKYQGVDSSKLLSVSNKSANRTEITFQTDGPIVNYKFLFVLLKKAGSWRIDSYKYQFQDSEKWNIGIL